MVKQRARMKVLRDNAQFVLAPKEERAHKRRGKPLPAKYKETTGQFLCPFCLHSDVITAYLISTKKGWHRGNGRCPECEEGFRLESLTARLTPAEFGKWVYYYPNWQFWKKCSWEKFNRRLKQLRWSYQFWKAYKGEKGADTNLSYEEGMMQEQREWAKERGIVFEDE